MKTTRICSNKVARAREGDRLVDRLRESGAVSEESAVPLYGSNAVLANDVSSDRVGHVRPADRGVVRWYAKGAITAARSAAPPEGACGES